jgi:hypothetical protein
MGQVMRLIKGTATLMKLHVLEATGAIAGVANLLHSAGVPDANTT